MNFRRPEIHVTAETGVLNAPAGVLRDGDTWHVFYQFQPTVDSPRRWGHVLSEGDPFSWEECDDVLAPVGGETGVRAGSVIAAHDGVDFYFTSVTAAGTTIQVAHAQNVESTCEVSDEPSALDPAIVRVGVVVDDSAGFTNFRSPCVVRDWESSVDRDAGFKGWLMLAVTGSMEDPTPVVLTSPDGRDWKPLGPLEFTGVTGLENFPPHLVAPRILRLRDEVDGDVYDVLLLTVETGGKEISGYLVGQLHGKTFEVRTPFARVDYGYDFTRPRNTYYTARTVIDGDLNADAVIFGLLNGTGRLDDPSEHLSLQNSDWANTLSLPRVLTLQNGKVYQTPYHGLPDAIASSSRARSWIGLCDIPSGSSVTVDILDDKKHVAFRVHHSGDELTVDRSMNPHHAGDAPISAPLQEDDSDSLSIFVDASTVEVFADGGQIAMASRVYIDGSAPSFHVTTSGRAHI